MFKKRRLHAVDELGKLI